MLMQMFLLQSSVKNLMLFSWMCILAIRVAWKSSKQFAKNKDLADVRVVMTSGLNVQEECLRRGANAFLLKPFMPDDLIRLLK